MAEAFFIIAHFRKLARVGRPARSRSRLYTAFMTRRVWRAVSVVLAFCVMASGTGPAKQQTRFVITGPTLISFFLDYTDKEVLADGDEALNDFVFYLPYAEEKLLKAGVQVHAVFKVKSFAVKMGSRWRTVQPQGQAVGYYFIAPGREPRVEFGVEDTESILDFAREYFRLKTLPSKSASSR